MPGYRLRERADEDLKGIWRWTQQQWNAGQADKYVGALFDVLEQLADDPSRGRSAEDLDSGLFRLNHQSHAIFYRKSDEGIEIVRILHQRMHFPDHLRD